MPKNLIRNRCYFEIFFWGGGLQSLRQDRSEAFFIANQRSYFSGCFEDHIFKRSDSPENLKCNKFIKY